MPAALPSARAYVAAYAVLPRAQLAEGSAAVLRALATLVRPGDLVLLGGLGIETFRRLGAHPLVACRDLQNVAPTGEERPWAFAATPEAAQAILSSDELRIQPAATLLTVSSRKPARDWIGQK